MQARRYQYSISRSISCFNNEISHPYFNIDREYKNALGKALIENEFQK